MILQSICAVLVDYMDLQPTQIWLKDTKANLPTDENFSIAVGFMGLKSYGSTQVIVADNTLGMTETIGTNMSGQISIDIMGRSFDVVLRKEEIIQAMKSTFCKEAQITNGFLIGEIPTSMNDISGLDGAAIPYRFQTTFNVQFTVSKTKVIDYYDQFSMEEYIQ